MLQQRDCFHTVPQRWCWCCRAKKAEARVAELEAKLAKFERAAQNAVGFVCAECKHQNEMTIGDAILMSEVMLEALTGESKEGEQ